MIKFVGDLRQVGGLLRFPQPIKLIDITDKLLQVALSTIKQTYALGFDCEELPPTPPLYYCKYFLAILSVFEYHYMYIHKVMHDTGF
jgi:hypothetical protein